MSGDTLRRFLNVVALVSTLVVNGLANALPINGQTTAEISNRLPILFVPANYVFSIWGLIYTLLLGFGIYQALPAQRDNALVRRIGYWFIISCVANITWILMFHYNQFALSMVAMLVLLGSLITIYRRIRAERGPRTLGERIWVYGAFSVYLGWITVATIANAAYVLFDAQWNGFGIADTVWTVLLLLVAGGLTSYILLTRRDLAYAAVILWALVGIVIKQAAIAPVAVAAGAMIAVIVVAAIVSRLRRTPQTPVRAAA
jgi:hypothetical protein